jgi:hypothetical protein
MATEDAAPSSRSTTSKKSAYAAIPFGADLKIAS